MKNMMTITGYKLRTAIKKWTVYRDAKVEAFPSSLYFFKGENKAAPKDVMGMIHKAETNIAILQTLQAQYNNTVKVALRGGVMPLVQAIKLIGGAAREEKLWRTMAGITSQVRRSVFMDPSAPTRNKEIETAERTTSADDITEEVQMAGVWMSDIQTVIAEGNGTKIEMEVDPALFE
jgi:hypothetical protein